MKFRKRKSPEPAPQQARSQQGGPKGGPQQGGPRWQKAQRDIDALRERVALLEQEVQEARQLNKRLAEITDVVAEVLLPAEQRDEERLREILSRYESQL